MPRMTIIRVFPAVPTGELRDESTALSPSRVKRPVHEPTMKRVDHKRPAMSGLPRSVHYFVGSEDRVAPAATNAPRGTM